jgi:plasmid replication initiation protein
MPRLIVKKANDLVEARTHLSLAERKAFAIAIAFTRKVVGNNAVSEINFEVLKKALGSELNIKVDNEFKKRLKRILEGLKSKKELALVEIPVANYIQWLKENGKEEWIDKLELEQLGEDGLILCGVIDSIAISSKENKIIVRFNPYITPLIIELKRRYTTYELKYLLLLDLKHSPILYELFKKNEKLGRFKISLEKLRQILGVENKPTYKIWGAFLSKILIPSLEEINEKTDIWVNFETEKGAFGKVTSLIFTVTPKTQGEFKEDLPTLLERIVFSFRQGGEEITKEGFAKVLLSLRRLNPAVALWFLLHYPEGEARLYAWRHIEMTEQNPAIRDADRFLMSLIKDKNPQLDWLLDQRTKDLIRKELEKLVKPQEGKEENGIEQLKREISQTYKFLNEKYRNELKTALGVEDFNEYLQGLVREGNIEKLREVHILVNRLWGNQWEEEF